MQKIRANNMTDYTDTIEGPREPNAKSEATFPFNKEEIEQLRQATEKYEQRNRKTDNLLLITLLSLAVMCLLLFGLIIWLIKIIVGA